MPSEALLSLAQTLEISPKELEALESQALAIARQRTPYTRLIDAMSAGLHERRTETLEKPAESGAAKTRQKKVLTEIESDMKALADLSSYFANPCLSEGLVSDWLHKRYERDWQMTPSGQPAKNALATAQQELTQDAIQKLALKRSEPAHTSVTHHLRDAGFRLMPRQPDSPTVNFEADGLGVALRLGKLTEHGEFLEEPKNLTIEALSTLKDTMRVAGLRHTLETLTKASDALGMHLHIKPQAIDLGEKLKPLDGLPLVTLYKNLGFQEDGQLLRRAPHPELDITNLLGLNRTPTSDQEMEEIAAHYKQMLQGSYDGSGFHLHHLFDEPKKIVRTENTVRDYVAENGWLSPDQAQQEVQRWKDHALDQGTTGLNNDKVVISMFDLSGEWSKPWREAGYDVYQFDIQAGEGVETLGINTGDVTNFSTEFFNDIFGSFDGKHIHAILAANPCTDFASSGARHFEGKDANGTTDFSVDLVRMTLATVEHFKPSIWAIENPTGRIERLGALPQWSMSFDPYNFGEDYTKRTMLWGRMNGDLPIAPCEPIEGSKMHRLYGGKSIATKNARSATPEGFAYAFFMANNAVDNPVLAITTKYDRLDPTLIEQAVLSGLTEQEIDELVEDSYYLDIDDAAANEAIANALGHAPQATMFAATAPGLESTQPSPKQESEPELSF